MSDSDYPMSEGITTENDEIENDGPPELEPEEMPYKPLPRSQLIVDTNGVIQSHPANENAQYIPVDGDADVYLDENGQEVQMVDTITTSDIRTVEFYFLDSKNVCCGLCGEIVPYDSLLDTHLPQFHPEALGDTEMSIEQSNYRVWLSNKLNAEKMILEEGFGFHNGLRAHELFTKQTAKKMRKVSTIRVNPLEMTLEQLDQALKEKMIEKLGRKVPVSLVDKKHAICGICQAVVSLNKKFEIVHLVRHFNAWHPSTHKCAGTWQLRHAEPGARKPLSIQDFAVVDVNTKATGNLQCIWCGEYMERMGLAPHFTEKHSDEIEVPKCLFCLQEVVINAIFLEKYGEDFEITLVNEFRLKCPKFDQEYHSEDALDNAIQKRMHKITFSMNAKGISMEEDDEEDENETNSYKNVANSKMQFGRRNKPKRSFVSPSLRQVAPANSKYVTEITRCHWKCKLCDGDIYGAVISAGAIKHYKQYHPREMENMQYELCRARLDYVSGGCMEFVHPQLVECLICHLTYTLHKPYNMCRGIRHLKLKHPEMMPENSKGERKTFTHPGPKVRIGEVIEDPEMIARFKSEYSVEFDKVQTIYGESSEPIYVLLREDEPFDTRIARLMLQSLQESGEYITEKHAIVEAMESTDVTVNNNKEYSGRDDPYGLLAEEEELTALESKPGNSKLKVQVEKEIQTETEKAVAEQQFSQSKPETVEQKDPQIQKENLKDAIEEYHEVEFEEEGYGSEQIVYVEDGEYIQVEEMPDVS